MDYKVLFSKISERIKRNPSLDAYNDLYSLCKECIGEDSDLAVRALKWASKRLEELIPNWATSGLADRAAKMMDIHKKILRLLAPFDFESFLLYVEWDREPEKKFYPPRRKALRPVVEAMQDLADDKLDLLAVSLPPGTGKSTLSIFYLCWMAGKYPDDPILTGSHSNSWVRGAYDECLRIMDKKGDYLWCNVFDGVAVSNTNAKDCRIDLGKRKRFETLEFTSIGTGNAGLYRAATLLYCDDLVSGIEVALSEERLAKLWEVYTTDLRQRKIGNRCKELHVATRWSTRDVIGRLEQEYGDSDRAKFMVIPAMDENDESNFDYAYGVGFSTKFYREQRDIMDDVSWKAIYMNEPIEREGLLYAKDELRRYFELPDGKPDAIISVCDTKDRGSDDCVMPIAYVYGQNYYIEEIVCDNSNPEIVDELLVDALLRHNVQMSCFESNSAGGRVAQTVQAKVKERGGITKIETKYTTSNKETKLIVNSPWVKEHCLFKDDTVSDRNYKKAIDKLCSYTTAGRNKHDDVPDAMAQLALYAESFNQTKVQVIKRPF